jgi:GTP-binding protein YchF
VYGIIIGCYNPDMSLSIGIIGLPNTGKSTLFNALLKRQQALVASYPFATVEPNVGIVEVPDERLYKIAELYEKDFGNPPKEVIPTTIKFVDIAGLVKGASEGQGLGNKFLSHIREVDAILHVVRDFEDENVPRGEAVAPKEDISVIELELALADLNLLEGYLSKFEKEAKASKDSKVLKKRELLGQMLEALEKGSMAKEVLANMSKEDVEEAYELTNDVNLLTLKPSLYVYNVDESKMHTNATQNPKEIDKNSVELNAKIENELCSLDENDQKLFMEEFGLKESGLDKVIKISHDLLNLITFFTFVSAQLRAWTIEKGTKAPQAAGKVHTDMETGFIKAEVVSYGDFLASQGHRSAKSKGLLKLEGKEYLVRDGDIIEFKFNVS